MERILDFAEDRIEYNVKEVKNLVKKRELSLYVGKSGLFVPLEPNKSISEEDANNLITKTEQALEGMVLTECMYGIKGSKGFHKGKAPK